MDRRKFLGSATLGLGGLGLCGLRGLSLGRLGGPSSAAGQGLGLASAPTHAQTPNFSGRIIELIIPFKEGGGSDTWGRFNAPFLSRYLPGQPTVVVRNVPGGNSIAGANRFASRARPDGLSVLGTSASTQFPYLMDDPRVRYEYRDWRVLMAYGTGGVAYVSADLGIADATELGRIADRELLYGSQGPTSLDLVPVLGFKLMGLNVRPIFGMSGRGAGRLSFERGEVNIDYQTSTAYLRNVVPLIEQGNAVAAVLVGRAGRRRQPGPRPHVPGSAPLRGSLRTAARRTAQRSRLGELVRLLHRGIPGAEAARRARGDAGRDRRRLRGRRALHAPGPGIHRPKARGTGHLRAGGRPRGAAHLRTGHGRTAKRPRLGPDVAQG